MTTDTLLDALRASTRDPDDHALAARYAPVIRFDAHEPFLPLAAGYTVFRADGPSPSFPRNVTLRPHDGPPAALAIEYAIWWDWDIGHLYELEHIWVYLDAAGALIHAEASWHGGFSSMRDRGAIACEGERALVYSEPGKHAFAPDPAWYARATAPHSRAVTRELAGMGGLLVNDVLRGRVRHTPLADTLARSELARHAFTPALDWSQRFAFEPEQLVAWPALDDWIPRRVAWWLERLERELPAEHYRFLRIGHRGAAGHAPDNSLAGIAAAARLGADMVENDARLTRDGVPVASHDAHVRDSAGRERPIGDLTLDELRESFAVPTLDEVIAACRDARLRLYLELKEGAVVGPVAERLRTDSLGGHAIIASFRPDWLADVRALAPEAVMSVLFSSPNIEPVALAASCGARYVHPCWEGRSARPDELLTAAWMAGVRDAGLGIITWHVERPEVIAGLRQRGVDGICSDRPELLR
jgi:glycerophosphoryl diester phosphodiesterase